MPSETSKRIEALMADESCDRAAKVRQLRQWEADALARQRASTEGMETHNPRDGDDLKAIETALRGLGQDAVDQGPASL